MVDLTSISAVLSSLSIATKFLKGSLEKIKDIAVREKVEELLNAIIPLQSIILSLQAENSAKIRKIQNLEKKLGEVENWAKEVESYELKEVAGGFLVYGKKPESSHTGPVVYLCPNCFDVNHKKSILQIYGRGYHRCPNCKNEFDF